MKLQGIVKTAIREEREGVKNGKPWKMEVCELVIAENTSPDSLNSAVVFSPDRDQLARLPKDVSGMSGKPIEVSVTGIRGVFAGMANVTGRVLSPIQSQLNGVAKPA